MSSQVHRDGDMRDCGATTTVIGQSSVMINGALISVAGDPNTHGGGELQPSNPGTIIIEGKAMIVVGDTASSDSSCPDQGGSHCNPKSSSGSPDVIAY